MKYTSAISSMKVLLQWGSKSAELQFVDVTPSVLLFEGRREEAHKLEALKISISIKVGQKWREWEEVPCDWLEDDESDLIGLVPQLSVDDQKEFKKYLELTLSI